MGRDCWHCITIGTTNNNSGVLVKDVVFEELHRGMALVTALAELQEASRNVLAGATGCAVEVHYHKSVWVSRAEDAIKLLLCKSTTCCQVTDSAEARCCTQ